jgi:hypothetical protein
MMAAEMNHTAGMKALEAEYKKMVEEEYSKAVDGKEVEFALAIEAQERAHVVAMAANEAEAAADIAAVERKQRAHEFILKTKGGVDCTCSAESCHTAQGSEYEVRSTSRRVYETGGIADKRARCCCRH